MDLWSDLAWLFLPSSLPGSLTPVSCSTSSPMLYFSLPPRAAAVLPTLYLPRPLQAGIGRSSWRRLWVEVGGHSAQGRFPAYCLGSSGSNGDSFQRDRKDQTPVFSLFHFGGSLCLDDQWSWPFSVLTFCPSTNWIWVVSFRSCSAALHSIPGWGSKIRDLAAGLRQKQGRIFHSTHY